MIRKSLLFFFGMSLIAILAACGGGGGGGGGSSDSGGTTAQPPAISAQPSSLTVVAGNNATISVTASGTTLSYQWQVDKGTGSFENIADTDVYSGSKTATLSLANVLSNMNGFKYRVVVTGAASPSVTSNSATLTTTAQTKAILKLLINNLPNGVKVGALQVHFDLPANVVPETLTDNDASGSIMFSGNAIGLGSTLAGASYVMPLITIGTASIKGFIGGEYLTVNCIIAPGPVVSSTSFPVRATIDSATSAENDSTISGLTVPISVTFQ